VERRSYIYTRHKKTIPKRRTKSQKGRIFCFFFKTCGKLLSKLPQTVPSISGGFSSPTFFLILLLSLPICRRRRRWPFGGGNYTMLEEVLDLRQTGGGRFALALSPTHTTKSEVSSKCLENTRKHTAAAAGKKAKAVLSFCHFME
jgi:hypothetical protein